MKVWLLCHQFLPEFYAGTETVTLNTGLQLQKNGCDVTVLAGHMELPGRDSEKIFVENYHYQSLLVYRFRNSSESKNDIDANRQVYWSDGIAVHVEKLIADLGKPDVIHVLHFAYIGLSVLSVFKKFQIPVVYTATDFFSVCPSSLLRDYDGSQCDGPRPDQANCLRHLLHNSLPADQFEKVDLLTQEDLGNFVWLAGDELPPAITDFQSASNLEFFNTKWFTQLAAGLPKRKAIMQESFKLIDRIVVPSKVIFDGFKKNGAILNKIEMLPFGLDANQLTRDLNKGQDVQLKLLFIGQISKHKGVLVLVEAIKSLSTALNISLAIYGDMNIDLVYAESLLAAAAGDARISFEGFFPPDQLGQIISKHDVIVIPSLWSENTPLVLLASQACGLPAIVSREEGLCEVVKDGINGLAFETGNVAALSQCITRLAEDRQLVSHLAARTAPGFTIADNVAQLQTIYQQVIS